ncbi:MAG: hypothetical protein HY344_00805 [Candidatus Levybacteria bacterium]|nr:hypothetical protein [Candidatus Levybacteria bacterium]
MDPNLSDQNIPPKPTSSVGNVVSAQIPGQEPSSPQPVEPIPQETVPPTQDIPPPLPSVSPPLPSEPVVATQTPDKTLPSSGSGSGQNDSEEFYPKGARINKKVILSAILLIMVVTVPLTVFVARQPQSTQTGAANDLKPDTVIAVFNGQNILEKDLETVALEQYDGGSIDREVLKDSLDILVERKILDGEKNSKQLGVSDSEIAVKKAEGFDQNQATYETLKEKVTAAQTKNWQVYTIGFWVPLGNDLSNLSNAEKETRKKRLDDGLKALDEAQSQLGTQKSALDIARTLTQKYPSLKEILGVNGYLLQDANTDNVKDYTTPRVYTFEKSNKGQPFFDSLYSMKQNGQVKKSISGNNSGGNVIKLVSANTDASFDTYEAWLSAKKKNVLTVVYSL